MHRRWTGLVTALVVLVQAGAAAGQEVKREFMSSGLTRMAGGYSPRRAMLVEESENVKVAPEGLEAPRYGKITLGDSEWALILDEPAEGAARLWIDSNGDGDLTNDPDTEWELVERSGSKMHQGNGKIQLADGNLGTVQLYRFDPADERRAQVKDILFFYEDFGYAFKFEIDGQEFSTFVAGDGSGARALPVDRDGNGQISSRLERVQPGQPFNFTGSTWVISIAGGQLTLTRAEKEVPQLPLPPDLRIGKPALEFTATTMDGKEVRFPQDYAGKLVMLDFWATWCGPCIAEIPNVKQAYEDWHEQGFEILGISFDREGDEEAEKVRKFLTDRELPWDQVYEGKYWDTTVGRQYDVSGIPFVLLVDGDTGQIIATSRQLRGSGLSAFIGKQLDNKKSGGTFPGEQAGGEGGDGGH